MIVDVRVKPGSKKEMVTIENGVVVVKIREKPIEGRANKALIEKLADLLGIAKSCVKIVGGERSKNKRVSIECIDEQTLNEKLLGG